MKRSTCIQIPKMNQITLKDTSKHHKYVIEDTIVYTPYQIYQSQQAYITYILKCLKNGENALIQSPTGTGKTMSLLCSTLSWLSEKQSSDKNCPIQIIYTSRTHAQLKQVISELDKLCYSVKIAILSSRDHACINDDLKLLNGQDKELECRLRIANKKGLSCKYYKNEKYFINEAPLGKVVDLEELSLRGKLDIFCPFYFSRYSKAIANIILMPYNYLLDRKTWSTQDKQFNNNLLENSIIILDEGHNIQSICEQSKQFTIALNIFSRALQQIQEVRLEKLNENKHVIDPTDINQKINMLKITIEDIEINASYIQCLYEFLQTLNIATVEDGGAVYTTKMFVEDILEKATSKCENFGVMSENIKNMVKSIDKFRSDLMYRPFWAFESWMKLLQKLEEIYAVYKKDPSSPCSSYTIQIAYEGSDIRLSIYCLDPAEGFSTIVNFKPKNIILTSGTLSPLKTWPLELKISFASPMSCPHILSKEQVNTLIVCEGPTGNQIDLKFENRKNAKLFEDIGNVLVEIAKHTKNGVVVFFPSYHMMQTTKNHFTNMKLMTKLYEFKNIYYEKKDSLDFKLTIDNYMKDAQSASNPKGAMLFALIRGKVSEGLDFSDKKCRAVVLVGVPYPASKDVKVVSKMSYLDQRSKLGQQCMNGNQWYMSETIRSINQGIGRIIRHKNDFGTIYLVDSRFKKNDLINQISTWARSSLTILNTFPEFLSKIKKINGVSLELPVTEYQPTFNFISQNGVQIGPSATLNPIKTVRGTISRPAVQKDFFEQYKETRQKSMTLKDVITQFKSSKELQDIRLQEQEESEKYEAERREKISLEKKIFNRARQAPKQECSICTQEAVLLKSSSCFHKMCQTCWDKWLEQDLRCPICRGRVREKFLIKE